MKRRFSLISICFVWVCWVALALFLNGQEVNVTAISFKEGIAASAQCIESRSVKGVKFKVHYLGSDFAIDDYISLPLDISCDDGLINSFKNKPIKISYYENHYLGVEVDGRLIRSVDESINAMNDKGDVIGFTLFLAIIVSFSLFMFSKHKERKATQIT